MQYTEFHIWTTVSYKNVDNFMFQNYWLNNGILHDIKQ